MSTTTKENLRDELTGAKLKGSYLTGAVFTNAQTYGCTGCPEGQRLRQQIWGKQKPRLLFPSDMVFLS